MHERVLITAKYLNMKRIGIISILFSNGSILRRSYNRPESAKPTL